MPSSARLFCRVCGLRCPSRITSRSFSVAAARQEKTSAQAHPIGSFYQSLIDYKTPFVTNEKRNEPPTTTSSPTTSKTFEFSPGPTIPDSQEERAKIIFGSSLAGPAAKKVERMATRKAQSTYIAGVLVPPRPEEPDNCCMSGCVNCVWDIYREDMEDWSAANKEAQQRLQSAGGSVDADGGGSVATETKIAKDLWQDDVFENVPVGIREFMKQEKRLREKHEREQGTAL
ncbi:hypothetical protein VHEMI00095 [[Torrubiella] hemipterigena]|uniref:Oxidoreductase-like domain-containing protein n=1 Tax=[Torrubiella] hemipterigena TaxID=1531966 RepID=A0A0A1T3E9_9HYPO|nr:hypothetical protein VHEMI00095 [[Torrubiella] hemipterigena]